MSGLGSTKAEILFSKKEFLGKQPQAADFCQRQAARVYFFENILQPVGHFRLFSKRSTRAEILFQKRIPYIGKVKHFAGKPAAQAADFCQRQAAPTFSDLNILWDNRLFAQSP
jgi:hypothetical protein